MAMRIYHICDHRGPIWHLDGSAQARCCFNFKNMALASPPWSTLAGSFWHCLVVHAEGTVPHLTRCRAGVVWVASPLQSPPKPPPPGIHRAWAQSPPTHDPAMWCGWEQ
jgi:hypothetical protein